MNVTLISFLQLFNKQVQYSVPRWQRRYSWDKSTILQLVRDLEDISKTNKANASHFGGTIITYSEVRAPGAPDIFHVVDGQQRLTTISILLSCIAEELAKTEISGESNPVDIQNMYLRNHGIPDRKLSLQDNDDEEYQHILSGNPKGDGKVTEAWKLLRSEVASRGPNCLLEGLQKFKVISFACQSDDDPQQIFESLNATGVPLTEGEKVKNWLLMGMDEEKQIRVYHDHWRRIENSLNAVSDPKYIDEFLRDFLRWKTGENVSEKRTYVNLKRWWDDKDRGDLCEILGDMAELYGKITGTNGQHRSKEINKQLRYLRGVGFNIYRPFILRVLNDAINPEYTRAYEIEILKVLTAVSIWLTRMWLSGKPTSGLNTEFVHFAHHQFILHGKSYAEFWIDKIKKLRKTKIAVPNEEEIREGIKTRRAYGGKASDSSKFILWEVNSRLGNQAPPRFDDLSLEHIMPRKLSPEWLEYLGDNADEIQIEFGSSLANLTLVGKEFNSEISNRIYAEKCDLYKKSTVMITRNLAEKYIDWTEKEINERVDELTNLMVKFFPWENATRAVLRWRMGTNDWKNEQKFNGLLLNFIAELLDMPEDHGAQLVGDRVRRDLLRSGTEPKKTGVRFKEIPGHIEYVVNLNFSADAIISLCHQMAERCNVNAEIEIFKDFINGEEVWEEVKPKRSITRTQSGINPRWRINHGQWIDEKTFRNTLLSVISALLTINPDQNSQILLGTRMGKDLFLSGTQPISPGAHFKPIPGYTQFVVNLNHDANTIIKICKEMGDRCSVLVEVENLQKLGITSAHQWRINGGKWRREKTYPAILMNLVAELLDQAPLRNPHKLSGDSVTTDLLPSHFSPEDPERFKKIPRYKNYKIYVDPDPTNLIKQCRNLATRCGVVFEVELKTTQS
ncbi:MAG: DUF262 domain-containing protein [Bacteroidetes bacterium]|nr:DUF262 domain-containing protein [Bacteroidota bacterium]